MSEIITEHSDPSQTSDYSPLTAMLWDEGMLTKENIGPLSGLAETIAITNGPHQVQLLETLRRTSVEEGQLVLSLGKQPRSPKDALRLLSELRAHDHLSSATAGILVSGTPFEASSWVRDLVDALLESSIQGLVILIPGTPTGSLTTVALTDHASEYAVLLRRGLAEQLGVNVAAAGGVPVGLAPAAESIRNQNGPTALVWAATAYQEPQKRSAPTTLSAADVVHAVMKDSGLEVTNRTDMTVQLRIHIGPPKGDTWETLRLTLGPRNAKLFLPVEMGKVGALAAPIPELRQWSHESEVVYEGGQRRIHGIDIRYLSGEGSHTQVLGESHFGSPDGLVAGTVSTEISRAIGANSQSMGARMSDLGAREDWRTVYAKLVGKPR